MVNLSKISEAPATICSIDASTNNMAFALFHQNSLKSFGKIIFGGKTTYEKISDAVKKTKGLFGVYEKIDAIVIEHTIYLNSAKTAADLALVQGAMLGGIALENSPVIKSINPIAWQTYLGNQRLTAEEKTSLRLDSPGKSEAWYKNKDREFRKQRTINLINQKYGVSVSDNDIADAIGVGHYAIHNWSKLS
jgi:Holliday junction resolvasome RuvABC endonuclease subunit